jgi:hypothetical protein
VMRGQSQLYPFTRRSKAYMLEGLVWKFREKQYFCVRRWLMVQQDYWPVKWFHLGTDLCVPWIMHQCSIHGVYVWRKKGKEKQASTHTLRVCFSRDILHWLLYNISHDRVWCSSDWLHLQFWPSIYNVYCDVPYIIYDYCTIHL